MKRTFKSISVILAMIIFIMSFTTSAFAFDDAKYVDAFSDEVIKGYLPQILEEADDDTEIDVMICIRYTESFDKSNYAPDEIAQAGKEFHFSRNEALAKTLPEDIKVTYVSYYAPVVCVTATKAQIYKIAEMDNVCDIWNCEEKNYSEGVVQVFETNRFGDLDGNSEVNAADARICLRTAAKLDKLSGNILNAADVNGDGEVTSADARSILRASAKIETLNANVIFSDAIDSKVVIGALETAGSGRYVWHCTVEDKDAVKVDSYVLSQEESSGIDGYPVQQFFEITIAETGKYNVKFELKNSNNEVIDKFSFDIGCYYTGEIESVFVDL